MDREGTGILGREILEETLVEHDLRPEVALLSRLEHEPDRPRERRRVFPKTFEQQARRPEQHRDVGVVATRVHPAVDLGRKIEAGLLGQRQGVHVGAHDDRAAGPALPDRRRDARQALAELRLEAELAELGGDELLRLGQVESELGPSVDRTSDRQEIGQDRAGRGEQLRR